MIKKAYFEITNVCNLDCSFCPGTKRKKTFVSVDDFRLIAGKLAGKIEYLYLHLMGEPTLHPGFSEILGEAYKLGFKVIITTNGTTLRDAEKRDILLSSPGICKVSISLHSFEANRTRDEAAFENYLSSCFGFASAAAQKGIVTVLRLWNLDGEKTVGENSQNDDILSRMKQHFAGEWTTTRSGMRLADRIFLEYGEKFDWPDPERESSTDAATEIGTPKFCHGLRDQIGILCDGTVVPCCLDREGSVNLGNLKEETLEEILSSPRAKHFFDSFSAHVAPEPLCRNCGYAEQHFGTKFKPEK